MISLKFEYVDIEPHSGCSFDSITVYDGNSTLEPVLGKKCGEPQDYSVNSTGSSLFVSFSSDISLVYRGFKATYSSIQEETTTLPPGKQPIFEIIYSINDKIFITCSKKHRSNHHIFCIWHFWHRLKTNRCIECKTLLAGINKIYIAVSTIWRY